MKWIFTFLFLIPLANAQDDKLLNHDFYLIEKGNSPKVFDKTIGADWIFAEQKLSETTPFWSNIRNPIGLFSFKAKHNGNLPKMYHPGSQNTFKLISLQVPLDLLNIYGEKGSSLAVYNEKLNKHTVEFIIHPMSYPHYKPWIKKYGLDKEMAFVESTPSSSARSLFVKQGYIAKTSIDMGMGGISSRLILESHAKRSSLITDIYKDLHKQTKGKLKDSKMIWDYFPEDLTLIPKENGFGGVIRRSLPVNVNTKKTIYIPWYALISDQGKGKERWIDILYKNSGFQSKKEFVKEVLTKPMVEMFTLLSFQAGITSELHQQNTVIGIDRKTKKMVGIFIRDMDAHTPDYSLRRYLNLPEKIPDVEKYSKKSVKTEDLINYVNTYKFNVVNDYHLGSYREAVRFHSVHSILKYAFDKGEKNEIADVLDFADSYMVKKFNEMAPKEFYVSHVSEFENKFNLFKDSIEDIKIKNILSNFELVEPKNKKNFFKYLLSHLEDFLLNAYERWIKSSLNYKKSSKERLGICSILL